MSENMFATVLLFTSMGCPNCPPAKKEFEKFSLEREDIETHNISSQTPQGRELGKQFNVMSVPTFIFYGSGHEKPMGLVGIQSQESLNKYADIALGKITQSQEKKFSIRNMFKK